MTGCHSIIGEYEAQRGRGKGFQHLPAYARWSNLIFQIQNVHAFCITVSQTMAGGTPITQRLVPDGRHSNRHPRKSPFCLFPSLSTLPSSFLHLLLSTSRNFSGESVEIGSRAWKGHKEEETKCDELGEGPKSREERDGSAARKKRLRKKARREKGESDGMRNLPRQHPSRSLATSEPGILSPGFFFSRSFDFRPVLLVLSRTILSLSCTLELI